MQSWARRRKQRSIIARFLRSTRTLVESHYNYGVMLTGQQKYKEAAEAYRRALEINPYYADAHGNYAYLLMVEGGWMSREHPIGPPSQTSRTTGSLTSILAGSSCIRKGPGSSQSFSSNIDTRKTKTLPVTCMASAPLTRAGDRKSALKYMRDAPAAGHDSRSVELLKSIDKDLAVLEQGRIGDRSLFCGSGFQTEDCDSRKRAPVVYSSSSSPESACRSSFAAFPSLREEHRRPGAGKNRRGADLPRSGRSSGTQFPSFYGSYRRVLHARNHGFGSRPVRF